jgi:GT2 family glycosyltransferase
VARPALSVIIVTYNSAADIGRCLTAVFGSDVPLEVVIVDNRSEDDTRDRVQRLCAARMNARLVAAPVNLGFAKAVNLGIAWARAPHVALLNPDCFVSPSTLKEMLAVIERDPSIGLAGCLLLNEDGTEQAGCRRYLPTPWRALMRVLHVQRRFTGHRRFDSFLMTSEPLPERPVEVEALSGALMLARRDAMTEVGLLDEGYFMHCEDIDWCVRFRQAGWKVAFIPGAAATHRKGASTRWRPIRVEFHKHKGMVRFYNKFLRQRYAGPLMWMVALAVWARFAVKAFLLLPSAARAFIEKRQRQPLPAPAEAEIKLS